MRKLAAAIGVVTATAVIGLAAGCGSDSEAAVPTGADVKGTYVQEGAGFDNGEPATWKDHTIVINAAEGQGFAGYKEYISRSTGQKKRETFNGSIGVDGEVFVADGDGFYEGRFVDGSFVGEYVEFGKDQQVMNATWTRK